jgi:poly(hydroxyalkanoate) granule-associated protein
MRYLDRVEEVAKQLPDDLVDAGKKVWLAGLGAVGIVGNTSTMLMDTLVDEGKRLVDEGKKLQARERKMVNQTVTSTTDRFTGMLNDAVEYVQDTVQQTTKVALNRLGMPSRRDVADLTARVEMLTAKVDLLAKKEFARAR